MEKYAFIFEYFEQAFYEQYFFFVFSRIIV